MLILLHSLELLLRHLFSAGQLESSILSLDCFLRYLDCFVSSPIGLWNLPLHLRAIVTNLVGELQLEKFSGFLRRLCEFKWDQLHHCDGLFQNRQWHTHIDDLFVDSLWREIRLCFTLFAGLIHLEQRATRLSSWCQLLGVPSPNPSVDMFPRILTGSPSCSN